MSLLSWYGCDESEGIIQAEFIFPSTKEIKHSRRMSVSDFEEYREKNKCIFPGNYIVNILNPGPVLDVDIFCEENSFLNFLFENEIATKPEILHFVASYILDVISEHIEIEKIDYFFDFGNSKGIHLFYTFKNEDNCYFRRNDIPVLDMLKKILRVKELDKKKIYCFPGITNFNSNSRSHVYLSKDKIILDPAAFSVVIANILNDIGKTTDFDVFYFRFFVCWVCKRLSRGDFLTFLRLYLLRADIKEEELVECQKYLRQFKELLPHQCISLFTGDIGKKEYDEGNTCLSFGTTRARRLIFGLFRASVDVQASNPKHMMRIPYGLSKLKGEGYGRHHFTKPSDFMNEKLDLLVQEDLFREKQSKFEEFLGSQKHGKTSSISKKIRGRRLN